jgi:hypothetical protein
MRATLAVGPAVATPAVWAQQAPAPGMAYTYIEIPGRDRLRVFARSFGNMRAVFDVFDRARRQE